MEKQNNTNKKQEMTIAILTQSPTCSATKEIIKSGKNRGHEMLVLQPEDLAMFISDNPNGHDRLLQHNGRNKLERVFAKSIDALIPRIGTNIGFNSTIVDHCNLNLGIFSTQSGEGLRMASNKLLTLQKCSQENIPTLKTVYAQNPKLIDEYINILGGLPVVAKTTSGSKGDGVLLLDTYISAKSTLQTFFKQKTNILIQEYLDTNGVDYRGVVVGNTVVASYKRKAQKKDFRANIHKGATAVPVELNQTAIDFCVKCARALNLHTAGIDFMIDSNGCFRLIECNGNYGFAIQEVTGVNIGNELIDFIEKEQPYYKATSSEFPDRVELTMRENESTIEKLLCEVRDLKEKNDILMKNEQVAEYFKISKNKELSYVDSHGKTNSRIIKNVNDLYLVMLDMFQLRN